MEDQAAYTTATASPAENLLASIGAVLTEFGLLVRPHTYSAESPWGMVHAYWTTAEGRNFGFEYLYSAQKGGACTLWENYQWTATDCFRAQRVRSLADVRWLLEGNCSFQDARRRATPAATAPEAEAKAQP